MSYAFSKTFATVGLILTLFGVRIRSSPVIGLLPSQSASPLNDSEYVSPLPSDTTSTTLAEHDANDDTDRFWHCGHSPKMMQVEVNDLPVEADSAEGWTYYETVPSSKKWTDTNITWSVFHYARFPKKEVSETFAKAFKKWSNAAPRLKFKQLKDNDREANIKIRFVRDAIQEPYGSGVLAHGFYPPDAAEGFVEFRSFRNWTMDSTEGYNLLRMATHEFGHVLGLYHSKIEEAIMFAKFPYQGIKGVKLHDDDQKGIQHLYGDKAKKPSGSSASTSTRPRGGDASESESYDSDGFICKMKRLFRS